MRKLAPILLLLLFLPALLWLIRQTVKIVGRASGTPANIVVDASENVGFLPRPWKAMAQGGEELTSFLDNLEKEVKGLGLRYIRIDHLYDAFDVVSRDGTGLKFNWSRLDTLVDKIQKTGAIPFFALSYTPAVIAKTDIVSMPRDWNEWSLVVQKTIEHYSGEKKIANVYYEVWNEPDLFGKLTSSSYIPLYRAAAIGAARARTSQKFQFGGPATTGLYKSWVDLLLKTAEQERLRLDFVSWHRYDKDPERFIKDIEEVEGFIAQRPYFSDVEVLITEWGPDSNNSPMYDNLAGAAHLLSVIRRQLGRINLAFMFSVKDGNDPKGTTFWGRWGLFSSDHTGNKPKPRYTALVWLNSLGEERLSLSGEGSWVTGIAAKKGETIQIILTNYDVSGRHSEVVPLRINGLSGNTYTYKEKYLSGGSRNIEVASTQAVVSQQILLKPNDSVLIEMTPK